MTTQTLFVDQQGNAIQPGDKLINSETGGLCKILTIDEHGIGYNIAGSRSKDPFFHATSGGKFVRPELYPILKLIGEVANGERTIKNIRWLRDNAQACLEMYETTLTILEAACQEGTN